ncbi:Uncharacterised protein [Mycobacteroides abscessus subsp. massiliense]|uniref:hypothetical protein n=1 Tax=Mycobacteroides abscessus TaxID=36809 RepID=UPI0009A61B78|nr:hypothetical protein [Mycobacteroides abscessus]SKZ39537.1 Uncharacterised protein [Mycobacteroides abscessus subsp. massiliense]SKZ39538.1 Uncharacterised protein [Mycobacteroides abscessus subsp. massiliense]
MARPRLIASRWKRIVKHPNFYVSILAGLAVFGLLSGLRLKSRHIDVKVAELAGPLLSFTSMGFAIALAAVALILAMPFDRVTALLVINTLKSPPTQIVEDDTGVTAMATETQATVTNGTEDTSAYLDLVAVFLITAVANVIASGATILWAVVAGGDPLLTSHAVENSLLAALVMTTATYSGAQMLTAIKTLYQVAVIINAVMRKRIRTAGTATSSSEPADAG